MVVGQPVSLLLHTQDRYGNSRAAGREDVEVELSGPAGKLLNPFMLPVMQTQTFVSGSERSSSSRLTG